MFLLVFVPDLKRKNRIFIRLFDKPLFSTTFVLVAVLFLVVARRILFATKLCSLKNVKRIIVYCSLSFWLLTSSVTRYMKFIVLTTYNFLVKLVFRLWFYKVATK